MTQFTWPVSGQATAPPPPAATFPDYGIDWWWSNDPANNNIGDVDPTGRLVSGPLTVAQAIARRLTTSPGELFYAPDYGFNVRDFLNESVDRQTLFQIESGIENECLKDERVSSADASVEFFEHSSRLEITVELELAEGPFELVINITAVTVEILLQQAA